MTVPEILDRKRAETNRFAKNVFCTLAANKIRSTFLQRNCSFGATCYAGMPFDQGK